MPLSMTEIARLSDELWLILDRNPTNDTLKKISCMLLQQRMEKETASIIQTCQNILSTNRQKKNIDETTQGTHNINGTDIVDEEVAGFAQTSGITNNSQELAVESKKDQFRWSVRALVIDVLINLFSDLRGKTEDVIDSNKLEMQNQVGDVIKIAFSASTSNVVDLRRRGLRLIQNILLVRMPGINLSLL